MDFLYSLQVIRENCPSFINYFFVFLSEVLLRGIVVIGAILYWCYDKNCGRRTLVSYSTAYSLNQIIKNFVCIPRPWIRDPRLHVDPIAAENATGYSFPSGHSVTAASIYGQLGVSYRKKKGFLIFMYAMVILSAFSRNWLGCHTIQDVLAAILLGSVIVCIVNFIDYKLANCERNEKAKIILYIIGIVFTVGATIVVIFKDYKPYVNSDGVEIETVYSMLTDCFTSCGIQVGVLLGLLLEEKILKFENNNSPKNKLFIAGFGTFGIGFLYIALSLLLKPFGEHVSHFVKYFIIFLFISFIYPVIFTRLCSSTKKIKQN